MSGCHRCRRALGPGEGRPVALLFRLMAGLALGAVHAGMWLWEDLSREYCGRCRKWLSFLSVVLASMALGGLILGLRWARAKGIL